MSENPLSVHKISIIEINRLAVPAILMGIAEPLISLVDTAFIGSIGTEELAAVGIASSFYLLVIWILAQTLTAISAIVSKKYGTGDLDKIQSLIPQALLSNILLGLCFFCLTNFFITEIFAFYQAKGKILTLCEEYFKIRSVGFPFSLATLLIFGIFRGLQNTSRAMIIAICGAIINVTLDYLLIFGITPLVEPMGLKGAAIASLTAQVLMFFLAAYFLMTRSPFRFKISFQLNPEYKRLAGMSMDLFVRTILLNLTFYLATRYATTYGDEVIASHTIALNIWLFSSFFIDGYAHAGNALSGKLLGGKKYWTLFHLGKKINRIALRIGIVLAVIYSLGYFGIGKLFTEDQAVLLHFESIFWLVILMQPINASAFAFDGIYKGLGETKILRNLLIGSTLFIFVPTIVGFDLLYPGLFGIWVAFFFWMIIRAVWLAWDFRQRYQRSEIEA